MNMLGVGVHSYGFMDTAFKWLIYFALSQFLLIVPRSEHFFNIMNATENNPTVVGIDVGGERKGFHAVALCGGQFMEQHLFQGAAAVKKCVEWCLQVDAQVIAVDAPCKWSSEGKSRLCETELKINNHMIQCFKTPTRLRAQAQATGFFGWVFHGETLYQRLASHFELYEGTACTGRTVLETFPNAVVCALAGKWVPVKPKATVRRKALTDHGYDIRNLPNIDYVDAALCALAAQSYKDDRYLKFGNPKEGFIIVPELPNLGEIG